MRLIAFGGDARVCGVLGAAEKAGWETLHITGEYAGELPSADAVLLPWARSFRESSLIVQQGEKSMTRESVLAKIPPCAAALVGRDVRDEELPQVGRVIRPDGDEVFLRLNARLTAAYARAETGVAVFNGGHHGLWAHRAGNGGAALRDGNVCHRLREK